MYLTPKANDTGKGEENATFIKRKGDRTDNCFASLPSQCGGSLNPDWVEWLMGWPIFLTSLEPMPKAVYNKWAQAATDGTWWDNEPENIPRVAKGVKNRVSRLKATGNGQVPATVAMAWRLLNDAD